LIQSINDASTKLFTGELMFKAYAVSVKASLEEIKKQSSKA